MSEQLNNENEILQNDSEENITPIADVEWCYQFFENEPVVFGFGQGEGQQKPLVIQLRPVAEDVLAFNHNGMTFRIFPRPITQESIELRNQQMQSENAS